MKVIKNLSKKSKIIVAGVISLVLIVSATGVTLYANDINNKVQQTQVLYHSIKIPNTDEYSDVELLTFNSLQERKEQAFNKLDIITLKSLEIEFDVLNGGVEKRLYAEFLEQKEKEYDVYFWLSSEMTPEEQTRQGELTDGYHTFVAKTFTVTLEEQKTIVIDMLNNIKKSSEEITQAIANREVEAKAQANSNQSNDYNSDYDYDSNYDDDYDYSGGSGSADSGSQDGGSNPDWGIDAGGCTQWGNCSEGPSDDFKGGTW